MTCSHFAPLGGRKPLCLVGRIPELDCHACPSFQPEESRTREVWTDQEREQFRQLRSQTGE